MSNRALTVEPGWVLYKNQLYHVSEFAHLPPKERPRTTCPLCDQSVLLKLGQVRVHHYAHAHEANCAAGRPETALHLNTKFHFYHELLRAPVKRLYVQRKCSISDCDAVDDFVWLEGWDDVRVEYRMDPFRPDIALLRQGRVVVAIEVLVTHTVDPRKVEFFRQQNIPWVEISASEPLYLSDSKWTAATHLPFSQCHPKLPDWTCAQCQQHQAEQRRQREEKERHEEFARNNYTANHFAKIVDYYSSSGRIQREVFYIKRVVQDGQVARVRLETDRKRVLLSSDSPLTDEVLHHFRMEVEQEIQNRKAKGFVVDIVLEWRELAKSESFLSSDLSRYPYILWWNAQQQKWVERATHLSAFHKSTPTCIFCGQKTDDWYERDNKGSCRCNACLRSGRSELTTARR